MTTGGTAKIVVDDRFFEVAAAQSSRYPALWTIAKETIQNSQDAGAKNIHFDLDGDWVTVWDDGSGGEIENFLTIGSSTEKNGSNSTVGYFSTAKVRICFIHEDWSIHTNDQFLSKGMLGNEAIKKISPSFPGWKVKIKSRDGVWDQEHIIEYVGMCNSKINVWLNGERLKQKYDRGTFKTTFPVWEGDLYVKRASSDEETGCMIARVNGLAMYKKTLPGVSAQVTLEIPVETSHFVLQENREGLVWSTSIESVYCNPAQALQNFLNSVLINPQSLKETEKTVVRMIKGPSGGSVETATARFNLPVMAGTGEASFEGFDPSMYINQMTNKDLRDALAQGLLKPREGVEGAFVEFGFGLAWMTDPISGQLLHELPMPPDEMFELVRQQEPEPEPFDEKFTEIYPYDYIHVFPESAYKKPKTKHARILKATRGIALLVAEKIGMEADFNIGLQHAQEANATWLETNFGDTLLIDMNVIKTTDSQLKCVMKLLRLVCHELAHGRGYRDHNERFILCEGQIFDKALDNLKEVRKAAAGLTVSSRYY